MLTPVVFFVSFIIRLLLIPLPGFKADIAYWKWWGMSAASDGISGPLINTAYNYPSFYLYILKATSHLYEWLTGFNFKLSPNDANFWNDSNFLYLFLIKLPYILADLGIGILIYKIISLSLRGRSEATDKAISKNDVKRLPRSVAYGVLARNDKLLRFVPLFAACLYLFNPVVIYNSSVWGQTDSLGAFLILISFYFLLTTRYSLLSVFSAIALFMKVQTVIFLPLLFLLVFLRLNLKETIKSLWVFAATTIVINLPFLVSHTMSRVLEIMYSSQAYFPYVSMNAYNLWWLFFGRLSSSFWDQNLIAGLVSFKMMGLALFGSVYAIAVALILRVAGKTAGLLSAFILISFAFFLFLTQMHERYLFPLFVFFPILLGILYSSFVNNKQLFLLSIFYFLLSVTTLFNLHQVMIMNYPDNTLPFLPNTFSEPLTRIIAFINVITFIILLLTLTWKLLAPRSLGVVGLILFFFLLSVSFPKLWLRTKPVVYLSNLSPTVALQSYGTLQKNKSVEGRWLSSLYYFFDKGLGTHANSQIIYNLAGRYKTFATNFGVDTEANEAASVVFKIIGDNKTLFTSPKMTRFSLPGYVKLDIGGVKNLELEVTDAGDGINSDHADWLEAKLYK